MKLYLNPFKVHIIIMIHILYCHTTARLNLETFKNYLLHMHVLEQAPLNNFVNGSFVQGISCYRNMEKLVIFINKLNCNYNMKEQRKFKIYVEA